MRHPHSWRSLLASRQGSGRQFPLVFDVLPSGVAVETLAQIGLHDGEVELSAEVIVTTSRNGRRSRN